MKLSKAFSRILLIAGIAVLVLFFARGALAKVAIVAGVKKVAGLPLRIEKIRLGVFESKIGAQGIKLFNPESFSDRVMADLPELYVDYDLPSFFTGKIHLKEVRIYLKEFVVVRNSRGELNLDSLTSVQQAKKEKHQSAASAKKLAPLKVDHLHLKVGKVIYKDYTRGSTPYVQEFNVNLDEHYSAITDPTALGSLVVSRALFKTAVARLADFDLGALNQQIRGVFQFSMDTATGAVEDTVEIFKKLLPISSTEE